MSERYSFPIIIHIEVASPLTGSEINKLKRFLADELNHCVQDVDYIQDGVQERIVPKLVKVSVTQ